MALMNCFRKTYVTCNDGGDVECRAQEEREWERWSKDPNAPTPGCFRIHHDWHERYWLGVGDDGKFTREGPAATDWRVDWMWEGKYLKNASNNMYLRLLDNWKLAWSERPDRMCEWELT